MTPEAVRAIKTSYATVATQPRQLASRFYQELFATAPNLRPIFPADLTSDYEEYSECYSGEK